jgi:hypothetical protein
MIKNLTTRTIGVLFFGFWITQGISQGFTDQTVASGINTFYAGGTWGSGCTVYDWNKDGYDDLTLMTNGQAPKFFQNDGDGTFTVQSFGITNVGDIKALTWVDWNNDGFSDIAINKYLGNLTLYQNNGDFTFTNISAGSGIVQNSAQGYGLAWGDVDNDGFLDLYVSNYNYAAGEAHNYFYWNNGDGTFTDASFAMGVNNGQRTTFVSGFMDFDRDGYLELAVLNDRDSFENYLFTYNGNTFVDISYESNLDTAIWSMTSTVGDYNNDGWLDYYMTNNSNGNVLNRNNGDGTFSNVASSVGATVNLFCWGAVFLDFNNDMWQDLFVGSQVFGLFDLEGDHALLINNEGYFNTSLPLTPDGTGSDSYGSATGDFNNDGFPDFVVTSKAPLGARLYMNDGIGGNYIKVKLEGVLSNRDAVGSYIDVYVGPNHLMNYTMCGEGYISQNSQWEHFGLGDYEVIDSLVVTWPSGEVNTYYDVAAGQSLCLLETFNLSNTILTPEGNSLCPGSALILESELVGTYEWSTGDTTMSITVSEPGDYWLQTTSANGVPADLASITVNGLEPAQVDLTISGVSCYGGSDGSVEFTSINDVAIVSAAWASSEVSSPVDDLMAGDYLLSIVDSNNCLQDFIVVVEQADSLWVQVETTNVLCYSESNGSVVVTPIGGTPEYTLNYESNDELIAGFYSDVLVDSLGCEFPYSFEITEPDELLVTLQMNSDDGLLFDLISSVTGGIEDYTYTWEGNSSTESSLLDVGAGDYTVTVIDANGCSSTATITVVSLLELSKDPIRVYPQPFSEELTIDFGQSASDALVQIYSSTGQKIKEISFQGSMLVIPLSEAATGLYTVKVIVDQHIQVFEVVKK